MVGQDQSLFPYKGVLLGMPLMAIVCSSKLLCIVFGVKTCLLWGTKSLERHILPENHLFATWIIIKVTNTEVT